MQAANTLDVLSLPDKYRFLSSYSASFTGTLSASKSMGVLQKGGHSLPGLFDNRPSSQGGSRQPNRSHSQGALTNESTAPLFGRSGGNSGISAMRSAWEGKSLAQHGAERRRPSNGGSSGRLGSKDCKSHDHHEHVLDNTPRHAQRTAAQMLSRPDIQQFARQYFNAYDRDRQGLLPFNSVRSILRQVHKEFRLPGLENNEAESLFKRFDVNGDQVLTFEEFFDLFLALLRRIAFDRTAITGRSFFIQKREEKIWSMWDKLKELGSGTFGTAYLCKHKRSGEVRAIKAVKKARAKVPVEDIEKEIMIMRQLDHPHIVRIFMWFEDSNKVYIVMEALSGGDLQEVILEFQKKRKGMKEDWIRLIIRQSTKAIAYCHNLRLIHKDLKPENIMLLKKDPNFDKPYAVIIDLGMAEMFSPSDPQGHELGGSPITMAPEVWQGTFGPKCDVWSLGCVLFQCLSGQHPFMAQSMNPKQWIRLHKRGPDWALIKTSGPGRNLCQQMLTFDEATRPAMVECIKHDWFETPRHMLGTVTPAQFQELESFCQANALKRSIMLELASRLPIEQAGNVVDIFKRFDVDGDGCISPDELQSGFSEMGIHDKGVIAKIFKTLDVDGDGHLSFSEFAAGVLLIFKDLLDDRLFSLFQRRDVDSNGYLDEQEAREFFASVTSMLDEEANAKSFKVLNELCNGSQTKISYADLREKLLGF
jgi:serine/threonine protein kinase